MPPTRPPSRFIDSPTEDGRYRLLVEAITDYAIYMLDPDGIVTSWNAGARRFMGYEEAEIVGQHFSRFYTEEDRAAGLPEKALAAATNEGKFEGEGWRVRKDGTRFWVSVVIDPIRNPAGDLIGYAKITRDLTERKASETTLRSSEEQFKRLVDGVADYSLYMLTTDGKVATWNAGAQRIKGYTPEEIIGQHFSRFYTEEDRQNGEPERALATARRDGRFEKEGWRVRKSGEPFWANVIIDAIRDDQGTGEIVAFAKITRDITEQRDARIALDRTREALFQSQKMEAIGQLTGGIAHDFNNLLTAIIGSLEMASRRVSEETVKRLIGNAMRGAQRGAALTQRMLVFARRQELNVQAVDIPAVIHGMSEMLERSLGPSVLIETRFPLRLPWVSTDPNQLEMALLNLMVNARDAMPSGGPIVLTARHETLPRPKRLQPGSYVCLSVTDTGEGMDEETLKKAVDPFFTTKEVGKGTGLGLPMVFGLAKESGGELVLKSREGHGTTAELWLPVAEKSPVAEETEASESTSSQSMRPTTILVVDDDPLVLTNMAAMLDDMGHMVFEAASAAEALAVLGRESTIELVVTDQAMPKKTGVQLIDEIRRGWPRLPVILATGYAELPPDIDPLQITLAKPFLQFDLEQAVVAALADPKTRRVVRFRAP
jgi:PAS domain S-box-containing protein